MAFHANSRQLKPVMSHSRQSRPQSKERNKHHISGKSQLYRIKSSHISSKQTRRQKNNFFAQAQYMSLAGEYNLQKTRLSFKDKEYLKEKGKYRT